MKRCLLIAALSFVPGLAAAQSLDARLSALSPGQWLSYEVPMQSGLRSPCCFTWEGRRNAQPGVCRLEGRDWNSGHSDEDPVAPDGSTLRVLARRGEQGVDRLHAIGSACGLDPGAATLVEAGSVDVAASLDFLRAQLDRRKARGDALMAIAHHAGDAADAMLAGFARGDDRALRRDSAFWLGNARGEFGYRIVRERIDAGAREDELNQWVFALSVSPVPQAAGELRRLAREHHDTRVRAESLFWLAQDHDDPKAALAILQQAVASDPSREVRKKAVFALSQLPADLAVPALRALVEGHDDRDTRREALFWLAQVDDEAVLPVFDELLGESR